MSFKNSDHYFLRGGGEMGEMIRAKDWSNTSLGDPGEWPQSLRTTLGILLKTKFPMFLWWGDELICFYNDAYRPSLGKDGKHPAILGMPAEEAWPEIWDIIKPLIDKVVNEEDSIWFEDMLVPIYRNGKIEDVYWTFSYSPVPDEDGKVAGVLVTCTETTEKVNALLKLEESNARYINNIQQAPLAMCVFRGDNYVVEIANEQMLAIWGKQPEQVLNKPIFEGLPEAKDQGLEVLLKNVYTTGEKFVANERQVNLPRNGKLETTYVNFVYEALKEPNGTTSGIVAIAIEVTPQVEARSKVEESEQKVRALVENAPFPIAVYVGKEMIVELANQSIIDIWGKGNDVIGKSFKEVLPELDNQLVFQQIEKVFTTGESFHTKNTPLDLIVDGKLRTYYFNYSFTPLYDLAGNVYAVMNTGVDLTDLNLAKKQIEESKRLYEAITQNTPDLIYVFDLNYRFTYANEALLNMWGRTWNDAIGKGMLELGYEPWHAEMHEREIDQIIATKTTVRGEVSFPHSILGKRIYDYILVPVIDQDGKVEAIAGTTRDITQLVEARKQIEESEQNIRSMVLQSPIGICVMDADTLVSEIVNDSFIEIAGKPYEEIAGKHYWDTFAEVRSHYESALNKVVEEGESFYANEVEMMLIRHGKEELIYVTFVYAPLKNIDGTVKKVAVWVLDNTPQVNARREIEEADKRFRNTVKQAPVGITILRGPQYIVEMANNAYLELVDRNEEEFVGRALFDAMPEVVESVHSLLDGVLNTGVPYHGYELPVPIKRYGQVETNYFDFLYHPLKEEDGQITGVIVTVTEVSEKVEARRNIEQNEARLSIVVEASELGTWELDLKTMTPLYSKRYLQIIGGYQEEVNLTHEQLLRHLHPDDMHIRNAAFEEAMTTGKLQYEARVIWMDNSIHWMEGSGKVFYDADHQPKKMIGTIRDITAEKQHQEELQEREKRFRLMAESLPQLVWETDEKGNALFASGRWKEYTGIAPEGEAEWKAIIHPDDLEDNTRAWKNSLATGELYRSDVRIKSKAGDYRWHTAIGEPVFGQEGKIKKWVGAFTDIQTEKTFTQELEKQVAERTKELADTNIELGRMNKELQTFAYISSHDLQEPLRKIQTFSTQIMEKEVQNLSENGKEKFRRMENAAKRMQTLIDDLLTYSRTNTLERKFEKVHLRTVVGEVREDLKEELQQKHATIEVGEMCEAHIIPFQFRQLLFNLISNSLKFSNPDHAPRIEIESEIADGVEFDNPKLTNDIRYCHLRVSDNGIGFEQQYSERIFEVFQRLHGKNEYNGTGIGLSIVKRIVENHSGVITARGELNRGATFDIYIPAT